MTDYRQYKCAFCDCCKTKRDKKCCLHWADANHIRDNRDFIDWEAFVDTKNSPEHDMSRCDTVYLKDNIVYFIELKNINWLFEEGQTIETVKQILQKKFTESKTILETDLNKQLNSIFVFSYDLNGKNVKKENREEFERQLNNNYFIYLESLGIVSLRCDKAFYFVVFDESND